MGSISKKKLLLLGLAVVLLAAIPLTLYLVQQQQEVRSRAAAATTLCFTLPNNNTCLGATPPLEKAAGDVFDVEVLVNPADVNVIADARLEIIYDPTVVATESSPLRTDKPAAVAPNQNALPVIVEESYSSGKILIDIAVQPGNPVGGVSVPTKIATVRFKALTNTTTPTRITFGPGTSLASSKESDFSDINVLAPNGATGMSLSIGSATTPSGTITPTATPSVTVTPTGGQAASPTPTVIAAATNLPPVCDTLNVDRTPSGTAPFSIAFTATGNDPDGTINKVSFDFGDGPVQDVTSAGGIGTKSVSVQVSHTYNNPGTFNVSATVTDNAGTVSNPTTCTATVTVTGATSGTSGGTVGGVSPNGDTSVLTPTETVEPTMKDPGPSETIMGIGIAGVILSILGGLLLFAL